VKAVSAARGLWRDLAPAPLRRRVAELRARRAEGARRKPRDLGELRRTTPFSTWGASRGGPIDRVYIGEFVERHARDVRGRVLEIAGDEYARAYGSGVTQMDILDVLEDNPRATLFGDIADAPHLPADAFDCVLVTQVLPFVWDVRGPFRTVHRILRPGGVLLATSPGLCRIAPVEDGLFGHWWNLTSRSARRLTEEAFGEGNVEVEAFGNVLAAAAFLYGLGEWDLTGDELAVRDPAFEVTVGIRAVKRA
jgi:SAM-dependent methyltransferase